ncbi:MAG: DUF6070 family protein [Lachnospiraceae bacterium]|nr:DUF6070 family protein [Lachnospiraceae bacterium]
MRYFKLIIPCLASVVLLTACQPENEKSVLEQNTVVSQDTEVLAENKMIGELYQSIYNRAYKEGKRNELDVTGEIITSIGKAGYTAVDINNYIDMVNPDQVEKFCKQVDLKEKGSLTIILIMDNGGFIRCDFTTSEGKVDVVKSSLTWKDYKMESVYVEAFQSCTWKYTKNGYLFFERYLPSGYDGASGHTAVRVQPLDKKCREYNMKYVLPVGYEINNLLITNWSEEDYSDVNFYDLFDILYRIKYGKYVPYESDYSGKEYEIPKNEFEDVIEGFFKIDSAVLEEKTVFHADTQTYRYRPRGLYDCECPREPYPEVSSYEEQSDGTIKLIVNGIWVSQNRDDAFTSELVIHPMENGRFQYVSNRVLEFENRANPIWYIQRLTDDEWTMYYSGGQ